MTAPLTIDFFHDVVCGWCFNISPRLRRLAEEFALDVRHHTFVLQDSRAEMARRWGSPQEARETILGHWAACRVASDTPKLFNIDGMRRATFDYPHGLPGALACKAAETLGGQSAHWDMFDRIQRAHIAEARNVGDPAELRRFAEMLGHDGKRFAALVKAPVTRAAVEADRRLARLMQVQSVPTLIIRETGTRLVNGPIQDLRAQIRAVAQLAA